MTKPTEAAVLATATAVAAKDIKPYVDEGAVDVPLIQTKPTPGPVVATRAIPDIGVTEWTLKNGVRVVVKPTDFKNDEVRMTAFANGGTSLAPDADFDTARFADTVVAQGGLGTFDVPALRKRLSGKVVSVNAHIGELEEEVGGSASASDLETMLQLAYLSFTAPRRDEAAFLAWKAREMESARNRRLSPETTFAEDLLSFSTQNHRRRQPVTPEIVEKIDLDKAMAFYKERFGDASGFTFVLVGTLDLDRTKTLVETYLGSLPSSNKKETWHDVDVRRPRGIAKKAVAKGSEPKARVSPATFHGPDTWSRDADNDVRMLGEVLRIRLREILREDMGGVYGVSASGSIARRPKQQYTFNVSFGCAPENIDKLEKRHVRRGQGHPGARHRPRLHRQGEGASKARPRDGAQGEQLVARRARPRVVVRRRSEAPRDRVRRDGRQGDLRPRARRREEVPPARSTSSASSAPRRRDRSGASRCSCRIATRRRRSGRRSRAC